MGNVEGKWGSWCRRLAVLTLPAVLVFPLTARADAANPTFSKDVAPLFQKKCQTCHHPGTAAPILLDFLDIAGSSCGALLPTGNARDIVEGVPVTLIDNGMPVVLLRAATGHAT